MNYDQPVVPLYISQNLERQLVEKTDAIQDAANLVDEWRNRARRDRDKSVEWEEKHNALERQLAEVTKQRDALADALKDAVDNCLWRSDSPIPLCEEESYRLFFKSKIVLSTLKGDKP